MFENGECIIFCRNDNDSQIIVVKMTNTRMFPLTIKNNFSTAFKLGTIDQSSFWQLIYGHLSFNGLNLLYKKQMVRGITLIEQPTKICEGYILGKQHRDSFPSSKLWRAGDPLELIHSNLCGSMKTPSLGKSLYF
jgi:hypothetical protein